MSALNINLDDKDVLRSWAKAQSPDSSFFQTSYLTKFISDFTSPGEIWGAFQPIKNEPPIDWSLFSNCGLDLCFPIVTDNSLKFYRTNIFKKGAFGIQEPSLDVYDSKEVSLERISGFFIPGLVFDNRGSRLGRGKSYYDRYLKKFLGLKVGLTWSKYFIQGPIPTEEWDVPMNYILTEKFVYQPLISTKQ